ncbi:FAD-binding oxidoreductase [Stenotrophomonas sp. C3(2023)]|uniref:NAD(P)/FAD-dependent oxidoreductase n=1 Tax=Stenotrophomonas sp. C3(2023) TaxID=3080277 RepID=UPI00293CC8CF|nr:FAD-binding oxidoreductase [Stenotrophomonas sp. C3(2023)]MDV3469191.1 FAD-binding oxidoreductase [Stenotrophomonas sp. C3(2023)]
MDAALPHASPPPDSWYAASMPGCAPRPALPGDLQADVAILGAGYTGLSAALELAGRGLQVVVLEAGQVGDGASGRNGGQVLPGYGCEVDTLETLVGRADARRLFDFSCQGVDLVRRRVSTHGIDCHWVDGHANVPIQPRQERRLRALQAQLADQYDYPTQWWDTATLRAQLDSNRYRGAMFDPGAAHLHPLAFVRGLAAAAEAAGAIIHEHSRVLSWQTAPYPALRTHHGTVRAGHLLLAGNALLRGIAPTLEDRIMPVGTYIGATPPLGAARAAALIRNNMAVADTSWVLDYFRLSHDHRVLFGGGASYSALPPPGLRQTLTRRLHAVFPQLRDVGLEHLWGGYVDITANRAPHWGRLAPEVYFAQGFSGHGVAAANLAGQVIAEAIAGQAGRLDVFARLRHRPFPGGRLLRRPLLVASMALLRLRDLL